MCTHGTTTERAVSEPVIGWWRVLHSSLLGRVNRGVQHLGGVDEPGTSHPKEGDCATQGEIPRHLVAPNYRCSDTSLFSIAHYNRYIDAFVIWARSLPSLENTNTSRPLGVAREETI